jgi:hypothetical protein
VDNVRFALTFERNALAINAKEETFPTEPLIMALLLSQHKMIKWLTEQLYVKS